MTDNIKELKEKRRALLLELENLRAEVSELKKLMGNPRESHRRLENSLMLADAQAELRACEKRLKRLNFVIGAG